MPSQLNAAPAAPQALEIGPPGDRVPNRFFRHDGSDWLAVLFPGWSYDCERPFLRGLREQFGLLGADVLLADYDYPGRGFDSEGPRDELMGRFFREVEQVVGEGLRQRHYRRLTLAGKSLGTRGLAHLSSSGSLESPRGRGLEKIEFVWLTPLFGEPEVWDAILKSHDRSIFVIGTEDPHFTPGKVERLGRKPGCEVVVLEGADHALETNRNLSCAADELSQTMRAIERFLMAPP
ncbi:MAG TPA: alpha/beta family hydrolase [Bdellovibrionales bacterium]|nr:alpha/beta family hydrolase [Bdellovibrionales bacterium]